MEYSIQELSRLSGVTTRALRWYDHIGPAESPAGWRRAATATTARRRWTGSRTSCSTGPSGWSWPGSGSVWTHAPPLTGRPPCEAMLAALEGERARLDALIRSVRDTVRCEERKEIMSDEQKFEALKQQVLTRYEQVYGKEAREKYGDDMVGAAQSALRNLTVEQYREWTGLGQEIQARLEAAVRAGLSPEGEEGEAITALHRRWLTITGNRYEPDKHRGIAELYVDDPRFTAYYDKAVPGCARFLRDAVVHWAK